ncbi:hypothetical protein BKA70DRAFT_1219743 [Coprinopsis sp. MPI-PUGE-AT-0042]|nr:hypothetical protein BKA70DRAFT_1219743 [Coprinopsis sp. MPI-PUGE-AT-0042]
MRRHVVSMATLQLSRGRSKAWSVDLCAARRVVQRQFGSASDDHLEYQRGRLLCPIDQDWENSQTREAFGSTPQYLTVGSWPTVLYQNLTPNPLDPWEGFLMNDLLLKVYRATCNPGVLYTPPRSGPDSNWTPSGLRNGTPAGLRQDFHGTPIMEHAVKYCGQKATVAYVVTLTVAALSEPGTYAHGRGVRYLYTLLSEQLAQHREAVWCQELLQWWDRLQDHRLQSGDED